MKKRNQGYDIHLKHICKNKRLCLLTTVFGIKENLFLKKDYLHWKIRQNNFVKVRKSFNIPHCFVCLYIFIIVRGWPMFVAFVCDPCPRIYIPTNIYTTICLISIKIIPITLPTKLYPHEHGNNDVSANILNFILCRFT